MSIGRAGIGRIAERLIANELEWNGFLVRDLNVEGIAANADLLAVKNGKVWQIQVKGCRYDESYPEHGWWFQYGYCTSEHIDKPDEPMFNRAGSSFAADVVVLICIKSLKEYQCIVLPIEQAENAAKINLDYAYRTLKAGGIKKKPSVVWTSFYLPDRTRDPERRERMKEEQTILKAYEDRWDFETEAPHSTKVEQVVEPELLSTDHVLAEEFQP